MRHYHLTHTLIRHILISFVSVFALAMIFSSCFEEEFISDTPVALTFSMDTLRFDTVFTAVGSSTLSLSIKNPSTDNVVVSSIGLAKGSESMFRINVDGIPGDFVEDIRILANDSIYVFVEVTVDPDQPLSVSPFIIQEQLIVTTGSSTQEMTLEAYGQNANYFPSRNARGQLIGLSCQNGNVNWDDDKPYVIYGLLFIDSCNLVIAPGTQVYVNGGLARNDDSFFQDGGLIFLQNGRMDCRGTLDRPITFQGARLESNFEDVSGQWAGLRFFNESNNNIISHTTIKNSIVGVRVDSAATLDLSSVTIANTSNIGLIGVHATINADNLLVHSNGGQSCALVFGGDYTFRHTTLANYENQSPALVVNNFSCADQECQTLLVHPLNVRFENSILMGSNDDEIEFQDATVGAEPDVFSLIFDHSVIRMDELRPELPEASCVECLFYERDQEMFIDQNIDNYQLDTLSIAKDLGVFITSLSLDLIGVSRDEMSPDAGCFEFQ